MITKHQSQLLFALTSKNASYIIGIHREQCLVRYHFGKRLALPTREIDFILNSHRATEVLDIPTGEPESTTYLPVEFSPFGGGDFRPASLTIRDAKGYPISDFTYNSYEIITGILTPDTLSPLNVDDNIADNNAETIKINYVNQRCGILVSLFYSVIHSHDIFFRWMRVENSGNEIFTVERAMSATLAFPKQEWEIITLDGTHVRERTINRTTIRPGRYSIGSTRGVSGHMHNPWVALVEKQATEFSGDCYASSLIYSGNFLIETDSADDDQVRVNVGIHPETTGSVLAPGKFFDTPQALTYYSSTGLNGLSHISHKFINEWLMPEYWRKRERPVLLNSWEAVYFDFNEEKLIEIAKKSKELGVELFVLDDGWFGHRNDDHTSLGDWFCNREKLKGGLKGLSDKIHALGLQFGIWVEPEMISVESQLYKAHPDWCLHIPGDTRLEARNQLVLDFSRKDVRDNIISQLRALFDSTLIDYVKWDMNRYHTNVGSALDKLDGTAIDQREIPYRFTKGLYEVLGIIMKEYPEILFEGCAGGGGRYDLGMMAFFPQYWTSDNTDAISRMKIQHGTSMVYPQITMGSHVADVPGHQVGRYTPLLLRSMVAMGGNYGLELDPTKISQDDFNLLKKEITWYKKERNLLQNGVFYRLLSPFDSDRTSWIITSEDKKEAVCFLFAAFSEGNQGSQFWKLAGLDEEADYRISYHKTGSKFGEVEEGEYPYTISGNELMVRGLQLSPMERDYAGIRVLLKAVN